MMSLALLVGIWTTACIQTQILVRQGFVKETYKFEKNGEFEFIREWYQDSTCTLPKGIDSQTGTLVIGKKISNMFYTGETFSADFSTQHGLDLGALGIQNNNLRVSRGMPNSILRNTMLSLFDYTKHH